MEFDIMSLEVEEPKTEIDEYTWTWYGEAGFGKSSICAYLYEDPAFWQWEQGQNALKAKKVPVSDWKMAKKYLKTLQKAYKDGKKMPFKTAIMDTVDFAWRHCTNYVCQQKGYEHPSDGEWGSGWDAVKEEWMMFMSDLEFIGIKPIFISHDKDKKFKPKRGDEYNQIVPSVPSGCLETIVDKVDMVAYCVIEKEEDDDGNVENVRKMYFRTNGDFKAKSRLLYFPEYIEYGDNPREASKRVKEAFRKAINDEFGDNENADKPAPETTKPKKTTKSKPKSEPKNNSEPSIKEVKADLEKIFKKLYKEQIKTPIELVDMVKKYTDKERVSDIDDVYKATQLLKAMHTI